MPQEGLAERARGRVVPTPLHQVPLSVPHVALNDGNRTQQLGFGLCTPTRYMVRTVIHGLKTGYSLTDTAAMYRTEVGIR
jgi:hypothetical protein